MFVWNDNFPTSLNLMALFFWGCGVGTAIGIIVQLVRILLYIIFVRWEN